MNIVKVISNQCKDTSKDMSYGKYLTLCENMSKTLKIPLRELIRLVMKEEGNVLFSPVALLMSWVVLINMTEGNTRLQLIEVLGLNDKLLKICADIKYIMTNEVDEGSECNVACSIWLNELWDIDYKVIDDLCKKNDIIVYLGRMGSEDFDKAVHKWVNENTGNMLREEVADIRLNSQMFMALYSTLYIKSSWLNKFYEDMTARGVFHLSSCDEIECDYLDKECECIVYKGTNFIAVNLELHDDYYVSFLLPEQGVDINELLQSDACIDYLLADEGVTFKNARVHMKIPKFNLISKIDITRCMYDAGIQDLFDRDKPSFKPFATKNNKLFISIMEQKTRLTIDEDGIEGASYVEYVMYTGYRTELEKLEEMEFILERPFLAVVSRYRVPLLVGVVNNPIE